MKFRFQAIFVGVVAGLLMPTTSWALEWGTENWGEEVWGLGDLIDIIPALPEIGVGLLALTLAAAAWWIMGGQQRRLE